MILPGGKRKDAGGCAPVYLLCKGYRGFFVGKGHRKNRKEGGSGWQVELENRRGTAGKPRERGMRTGGGGKNRLGTGQVPGIWGGAPPQHRGKPRGNRGGGGKGQGRTAGGAAGMQCPHWAPGKRSILNMPEATGAQNAEAGHGSDQAAPTISPRRVPAEKRRPHSAAGEECARS